ncbi:MAG: 23S rRNA (adenine(2503)-C(2))-methyltransferase RlmN [Pirellulaceae bacterium]|nr:23S rRNA (adenine(2503)-C(2))-methyltransferase RlmN [Pirellulaceae bacterium]
MTEHRDARQLGVCDPGQEPLARWLAERGYPAYRLRQIQTELYLRRVASWSDMQSLPKALRAELADAFALFTSRVVAQRTSADRTQKLLLELWDGARIECVLLPGRRRWSICISTQVGCAMGCVFCASGLQGVQRNLSSTEIVEQMAHLQRLLGVEERFSHIVVMGMGEPLANLDQLLPALDFARRDESFGIGTRRITISTVGLPAAIRRLARHTHHYHLAVSLHAPTDALRNELVPVNARIGLGPLLEAADEYFDVSGRRLTYEYVLLGGVNDQPVHARQLARLLRGRPALLNVIPYNPVQGLGYRTPDPLVLAQFRELLEAGGVQVQFRQKKGDTIDAACGQLRRAAGSG